MPYPESYLVTLNLSGHEACYPYARIEAARKYQIPNLVAGLFLMLANVPFLIAPHLEHRFLLLRGLCICVYGCIAAVIWLGRRSEKDFT